MTALQKLLLMALLAYLLSIGTGLFFQHTFSTPSGGNALRNAIAGPPEGYLLSIAVYVIEFAVIFILIKYLGKQLFNYYGYFIVGLTGYIIGVALLVYLHLYNGILGPIIIGIILVLAYHNLWKPLFNVFTIFVVVVVAGFLGNAFGLVLVLLIFAGMCVYDLIAVFGSNFMNNLVAMAVSSEVVAPLFITTGSLDQVKERFVNTNKKKPTKKQERARLLGGGDLIFGGIFACAVTLSYGLPAGIVLALAALVGVYLNSIIAGKYQVSIPALPLIFAAQLAVLGVIVVRGINLPIVGVCGATLLFLVYMGINKLAGNKKAKLDLVVDTHAPPRIV